MLIAAFGAAAARQLAGILQSSRGQGAAAVLLGTCPAGTTWQAVADATVAAATPRPPGPDQTRLFTSGPAGAAAIISVLLTAGGTPLSSAPVPAAGPGGNDRFPCAPAPATRAEPGAAASRSQPVPGSTAHPAPPPAGSGTADAGQTPADRLVRLTLLGPPRVTAGGREVAGGLRKARELLAFLAVHPAGASGEAISEALWPESGPEQAAAQRNLALRKARQMLRAATGRTAPRWIIHTGSRYRLDPALISSDLQDFTRALDTARHAAGDARLAAFREAVSLYAGELADGTGYEWAGPHAEAVRRRALDAWTAIADILQPADPDQALAALEAALTHDPYNEYLYAKIMRLQAQAGRPEAVRRTLRLLETRLAGLGITPSARTRQAAASLLAASPALSA